MEKTNEYSIVNLVHLVIIFETYEKIKFVYTKEQKCGGAHMIAFFRNLNERRREKILQRGLCPDCSGRGFFSYGIDSMYIHDCDSCSGTGKSGRDPL